MEDRANNDGIDFIHMLSVMYRNWKFMTIVVLVSILTIGLLSVTQKRMYGSWVIFFPVPMREYLNKDNLSEIKSRQLTTESLVLSLLRSRTMAEKIIQDFGLQTKWGFKDMAIGQLLLRSRIKIEINSGIITLSFRDYSGKLSADIANAFVGNLEHFNETMGLGLNRSLVKIIDRAVVSKQKLPRGTVVKVSLAAIISFVLSFILVSVRETFIKNDYLERIRQS